MNIGAPKGMETITRWYTLKKIPFLQRINRVQSNLGCILSLNINTNFNQGFNRSLFVLATKLF